MVAATSDPNPLVAGKGLQALREAGLEVRSGILETEARRLNEAYFKYIVARQPFVTVKAAMSLDGKIAARSGDSQWITGPESRNLVQQLRMENDAVLVGIGTVLADDPMLTVRMPGVDKKPLRVVADSSLRIPLGSQLVQTAQDYPTAVAGVQGQCPASKREMLIERGVAVWELPAVDGQVDTRALLLEMGSREVVGLLLEGGSLLNASFLQARAIDKYIFFVAPRIIGGSSAPGPFGSSGGGDPGRGAVSDGAGVPSSWRRPDDHRIPGTETGGPNTGPAMRGRRDRLVTQMLAEPEGVSAIFTGIVEETGLIRGLASGQSSASLTVEAARVLDGLRLGDSIAVNGACLTVTGFSASTFTVDVMPETLLKSNLGRLQAGSRVNLERALAMGARLGGHLVAGHVDATGAILSLQDHGIATEMWVAVPDELEQYLIPQGSVALDGVSLTIAALKTGALMAC